MCSPFENTEYLFFSVASVVSYLSLLFHKLLTLPKKSGNWIQILTIITIFLLISLPTSGTFAHLRHYLVF